MKKLATLFIVLAMAVQISWSQKDNVNYDESKVPVFEVPNPLKTFNGRKIGNTKQWLKKGRPELLSFFTENVYGKVPGELKITSAEIVEQSDDAFNGKAKRRQIELNFQKGGRSLSFDILVYLPKGVDRAPVFLGYNFYGNHTVTDDVNVIISEAWTRDNPSFGIINNQLTEQSRGVRTNRWPIEKMLDAGIGLATIYYGEVDPDKYDFSDGVHPFFYVDGQQQPGSAEWGSIAAWAWGLSRAMDYFETFDEIDEDNVILFGHSRLGKTSLWAGATDERFAGAISNNSGCGGAALSKRKFGETVARINTSFPHWFCKKFRYYNNNEEALPADQHELIALIAPRPVYVASAEGDRWADPHGEFLSAFYASKVYKLFGKQGIQSDEMPAVNEPVQNTVAYHVRTGKHDVTDFDWEQYIKWAKKEVF